MQSVVSKYFYINLHLFIIRVIYIKYKSIFYFYKIEELEKKNERQTKKEEKIK